MNLETLITILILLILGIILIKTIRKILTIILTLVLLYFAYYTFMTYPGAVKFALFQQTFSFESYRVAIKLGDDEVISLSCKSYKPIILCESEVRKED